MLDRTSQIAAVTPVCGRALQITRAGRVLLDVSDIEFGERSVTAIVGPNGAGKSMLIKTLCGLMRPDRGNVTWNGRPPARSDYRRLGMLLQHPVLLRRSALANVAYALKCAGHDRSRAERLALAALEHAGLSHIAATSARRLSGGEKQRLAMARAMAMRPEILFLDEPTASLDPASTLRIEEMIDKAREEGTSIVLVTHDMAQARRLADTVMLMHRGGIVEHAPTQRFFDAPATDEARAFAAGEILI
ncbi:ATP-binding cassette domain-containing protein [Pararhizobium haloflavum]|uniref:ATP-binding cassette domain-containing protein n=1 Tax=Pararhizobium haloflavum TaxID=2037914 RepID=UPI000C19C344|nr:ATP-binding cassette domain-containing protein [Pararhizobium haloflavum]